MSKITLDHDYLAEAMHTAAAEVFTTMLGSEVTLEPFYQGSPAAAKDFGLLSLLGITGEWTGSGGLACSAASAQFMASQMVFSEYPEVNDEVLDAIGEITNMIVGNFKNSISSLTGPLAMSTPNVVFGREMTTGSGGANEWMVFPFSGKGYSFRMMVRLHRVADVAPRLPEQSHALAFNAS